MNTTTTLQHTNATQPGFHLPTRGEMGYIATAALMPYLLACILLAV
jgi:hypothetical protein